MRHIGSVLGLLALATAPAFTNPEMTEELPGGATMDFIWIDPGTFTMGSPSSEPGRYSAEGPQHEVTISRGFWLGKYEVTQRQWETVMGTTPWSGQAYVQPNPDHPAVYISSADVQGLVQALDLASGDSLYRLPTEAEWEYACRAGTTTRWSFGDDERQVGEHAWYLDNAWDAGLRYAQPVGTKLPNPWGLHDMHGNVWEWVQDYGSYSGDSQVDPQGAVTGATRVVRSATFDSAASGHTVGVSPQRIVGRAFRRHWREVAEDGTTPNKRDSAILGCVEGPGPALMCHSIA